MVGQIDLDKVKLAAEALGKLNSTESAFLKAYLTLRGSQQPAEGMPAGIFPALVEPAGEPAKETAQSKPRRARRGPDKRGHFRCPKCQRTFPTLRGQRIHGARIHHIHPEISGRESR